MFGSGISGVAPTAGCPQTTSASTRTSPNNNRSVIAVAAIFVAVISVSTRPADAATFSIQATKSTLNDVETTIRNLEQSARGIMSASLLQSSAACDGIDCSTPACGDRFPQSEGYRCVGDSVTNKFGNATAFCSAGGVSSLTDEGFCGGLVRSLSSSSISLPPGTDFKSRATRSFICRSQGMDQLFRSNVNKPAIGWQYVANVEGALRVFPGSPQGRSAGFCNTFDVRRRPWYVAALSGPKDVVIVYDRSGSMGLSHGPNSQESRMDAVKKAVGQLLTTFTLEDFVAVVPFSSSASPFNNTLQRARPSVIRKLQQQVAADRSGGGTVFSEAFASAFSVLARGTTTETSSSCTRIVIFLTDGQANDGDTSIFKAIKEGQAKLKSPAHIFTYSMGEGADVRLPRQIACENRGVWSPILSGENPLDKMSQYYRFLSATSTADKIRWSAPYVDALGGGLAITASKVIVDNTNVLIPRIIGVVAMDVTFTTLGLEQNEDVPELETELIGRGSCPLQEVDECDLQLLRAETGHNCSNSVPVSSCGDREKRVKVVDGTLTDGETVNDALCRPLNATTRAETDTSLVLEDVMCCTGEVIDPPMSVIDTINATFSVSASYCESVTACQRAFCACAGTTPDSDSLVCQTPASATTTCEERALCLKQFVGCTELILAEASSSGFTAGCTTFRVDIAPFLSGGSAIEQEAVKLGCVELGNTMIESLGVSSSGTFCGNTSMCDSSCAFLTAAKQAIPTPAPIPGNGPVLFTGSGVSASTRTGALATMILMSLLSGIVVLCFI